MGGRGGGVLRSGDEGEHKEMKAGTCPMILPNKNKKAYKNIFIFYKYIRKCISSQLSPPH